MVSEDTLQQKSSQVFQPLSGIMVLSDPFGSLLNYRGPHYRQPGLAANTTSGKAAWRTRELEEV